jgi:hypothetical protein
MRTVKLNGKINKKKYRRTKRVKMIKGGGEKRKLDWELDWDEGIKRTSSRGQSTISIPTIGLGGEPTSTTIGDLQLTKEQIQHFVDNKIVNGPQLVTLPTPPDSHSIFVNVIYDDKVMISDWGGEENQYLGIETNKKNKKNKTQYTKWRQYTLLIECLKKKYTNLSYYPVDRDIDKKASDYHSCNDQGGCSTYIHYWIAKHYLPIIPIYESKQ